MPATLRAALRLAWAVWHVLHGWCTVTFAFPRLDAAAREARVQAWAAGLLRVLGIRLAVRGTPPAAGPLLLVANHISWLDILVLHAARHVRFVSKADVKHWPLIGAMATGAGTLYIERASRRDAMRVVHRMAESLAAGELVAVFPEGTTTDGTGLLPFHANLIQAAVSAHAPVLPLALRYADTATGAHARAAAYVGDDTLVGSLWQVLKAAPITAEVSFGTPQHADGRDRRRWAEDLRAAVAELHGQRAAPGP